MTAADVLTLALQKRRGLLTSGNGAFGKKTIKGPGLSGKIQVYSSWSVLPRYAMSANREALDEDCDSKSVN